MFKIRKLFYSPVKSLSFSSVNDLKIIKKIGIKFDRNFAFTRDLDDDKINYILNNPLKRQIINFLSLYLDFKAGSNAVAATFLPKPP